MLRVPCGAGGSRSSVLGEQDPEQPGCQHEISSHCSSVNVYVFILLFCKANNESLGSD